MKRTFKLAVIGFIFVTLSGSGTTPDRISHHQKTHQEFLNYTWYYDRYLTSPTGTISEINIEIARLRDLFSGYTFGSSPAMGLHEYEYGYYPNQLRAIIYSDMY